MILNEVEKCNLALLMEWDAKSTEPLVRNLSLSSILSWQWLTSAPLLTCGWECKTTGLWAKCHGETDHQN